MGLHHLMGLKCDYNITILKQFYATLVICGDDARTLKWMTGNTFCTATFREFGEIIGYDFQDINTPSGIRLHGPERTSKDRLASLYGTKGVIGENQGLLPLYDLLVRIFRENIAPSGGNNDSLRGTLVDLLLLAHEVATSEDLDQDYSLDVMDYIYHEMFDAMINRYSMPYAPYVMMLVKVKMSEFDLSDNLVQHKFKRFYVTKNIAPTASVDAFMAEDRKSVV